jgi:hypothetical protein
MIPLPLLAIGALLCATFGATAAYKITSDHYKAAAAEQERAAAVAYAQRTEQLNAVSADLERARHERKIVYKTITQQVDRIVTRDVYRNTCLDADGVSIINDALAGRASAGQPADAVLAAGAAAGNDRR